MLGDETETYGELLEDDSIKKLKRLGVNGSKLL